MDNFDKIIKQKVDQFEVPYNDAHWAEIEGRLDAIRSAKIRRNILSASGIMGIVAIVGYFIFNPTTKPETELNNNVIAENETTEITVEANDANQLKEEKSATTTNIIHEAITEDENVELVETESGTNELLAEDKIEADNTPKEEDLQVASNTNEPNTNTPNAEFIVYNNRVCLGEQVSFEGFEDNFPVSYTWNFGDGTISHEANPKHTYNESHTYTVSLTLLDRQTGREYTTIQEDVVTILPLPSADFSYVDEATKHDDNKLKYPYTTFSVKDYDKQNSYKWTFGNGESTNSRTAKTIYKDAEEYTATLIVKNTDGCTNIKEEKIIIKNGINLFAPNAFTPNNSGGNETFIPKALLGWDVQFSMTIIDKSSKVVYTTSDKDEPWNGRLNNTGQVLPEGLYFWKVTTIDAEGVQHGHHGQIHLIK